MKESERPRSVQRAPGHGAQWLTAAVFQKVLLSGPEDEQNTINFLKNKNKQRSRKTLTVCWVLFSTAVVKCSCGQKDGAAATREAAASVLGRQETHATHWHQRAPLHPVLLGQCHSRHDYLKSLVNGREFHRH